MKKFISFFAVLILCAPLAFAGLRSGDGRKTVTTGGTAEALAASETLFTWLRVCAETDNTGVIVIGDSPIATLATREGTYLNAGDCEERQLKGSLGDLQAVKIDTTVNGDGVTFEYIYETP